MPTLDWLNRAQAFTTSGCVPYRLLEEVSVHTPTTKTETSQPERDGVGMSGQLDALLA